MSRSQMRYHPRIGYVYMPNAKFRVQGTGGGYLVRTNATGFRSDREFVGPRAQGTFRALLFGDSQTAGDGGANAARFGDRLERAVPGLEIYNYGLSGSGPDQQWLAYQEYANVEHDLLVITLYVENIRRVNRRVVKSRDEDGNEAYYAKPYYLVEDDQLVLHNVPVPKQPWTERTLPADYRSQVYSYTETNFFSRGNKVAAGAGAGAEPSRPRLGSLAPLRSAIKSMVLGLANYQPLPDYDSPQNPEWLLLRRILATWIAASKTPVLLVPIPHYVYFVASSEPQGYQSRFRELARDTGCQLYDPLPDIWKHSARDRRGFWCDASGHLSPRGHEVLAELLTPVLAGLVRAAA